MRVYLVKPFIDNLLEMSSRLTKQERDELAYLRDKEWYSRRKVWLIMKRDHTVVMREYQRNKKRWWWYDPKYADRKARNKKYWRKRQSKKIRIHDELENYIIEHLNAWWAAECVAGRWNKIARKKTSIPEVLTSGISIRRYINSRYGSYIKRHLQQIKRLRTYKKRKVREKRTGWNIKHRVFIDQRPLYVSHPTNIGHYECDFIESIKGETTVLITLIEKLTRHKIAVKLPSRESEIVKNVLLKLIKKWWIKSITFDNDNGFSKHYLLWIDTYFCHTYSSREKGQIENGNRGYRTFLPKWTILKNISQDKVSEISQYLNDYPMKCLDYLTPNEKYESEILKLRSQTAVKVVQ